MMPLLATTASPNIVEGALKGGGQFVENQIGAHKATTASPNIVEGALKGGGQFVENQIGAHKDELMHTVGDLAEKVGVSRAVAEVIGGNLLQQGIQKGKELLSGHAAAENIDKAKEKAKADPSLDKALPGN
ncbi:unnamed protein product [Gongylonema pulchrum]|uniref:Senescence domain-containing protein n=1 Tax=Gongylonema pulchrum TaxID=637853 RepID=A0A183E605_9BILA|nr:unnamed protein product [Gongylonema pulchrum]